MEEQLAALVQSRRDREQNSQSSSSHTSAPSSGAGAAQSNPAVTSLPHRNKHAPPPKVKLLPFVPPNTAQSAGTGTGSRADPIVFGEASPLAPLAQALSQPKTHRSCFQLRINNVSSRPPAASLPHPATQRLSPFALPTPNLPKLPSSRQEHSTTSSRTTIPSITRRWLRDHHPPNRDTETHNPST